MKKCFTINQMRTREDFLLYMELLEKGIYQGVELFYPYNQGNAQIKQYTESVYEIIEKEEAYQKKIAEGIAGGIMKYLEEKKKNTVQSTPSEAAGMGEL